MKFDGPDDLRYSTVNFNVVPRLGELLCAPNIHFTSRPVHITLAEAIPGSEVDRIDEIKNAGDALRIFKELVHVMCPWHAEAFATSRLADPKAWLAGAVRPMVRRPVATLPSGRPVFGVGDITILNDPIAGQGGNCTAYQVWELLQGIAELEEEGIAPDWYQERFDAFWEARGKYFTALTHRLLDPPDAALELVFDAVGTSQAVADRLVDAFREPWELHPSSRERQVGAGHDRRGKPAARAGGGGDLSHRSLRRVVNLASLDGLEPAPCTTQTLGRRS